MTRISLIFELGKHEEKFSFSQEQFLILAANSLKQTINSNEFKKSVLTYKFKNKLGFNKYYFRMNKGFSRREILEFILSGKDKYEDSKDFTINFVLCPYVKELKYHAYTSSKIKEIYINTVYLDYCMNIEDKVRGISKIASTLIHEYTHNLGFDHKTNKPSDYNNTTVPYAIGKMTKKIIKKNQN